MPRTNSAGEFIKNVRSLSLIRLASAGAKTVTTEAILGDGTETEIDVDDPSGFSTDDLILAIGDGGVECVTIGAPDYTLPIAPPFKVPQAEGCRIEQAELVDFKRIAQNSITWNATRQLTSIFEELRDTATFFIPGPMELGINFALMGYNGPDIQTLLGYTESETGNGAAYATAYQTAMGIPDQSVQTEQVVRLGLLRHDGKKIELDFCDAVMAPSVNAQVSRTQASILNATVKASALIVRQWV